MAVGSQTDLVREIERLQAELARRELETAATLRALSNAVEARDAYTSKHAERVAAYAIELGSGLGLPLAEAPELEFGFLLHDIGKLGIPDAILFKPSALTDDERRQMARHPVIGAEIVSGMEFLGEAASVVRSHHERWDGRGYPDGLAGEDIPLSARVFAVADVLDALTTDRPYRSALSLNVAREMIIEESGQQFDPRVIDVFVEIRDETFERIAAEIG